MAKDWMNIIMPTTCGLPKFFQCNGFLWSIIRQSLEVPNYSCGRMPLPAQLFAQDKTPEKTELMRRISGDIHYDFSNKAVDECILMAHYRTESFQQKHSYMLNMLCYVLSFLFFSVFIWPQEPKYGNERISKIRSLYCPRRSND